MALGTAGAIRIYQTKTGYRARVPVRDHDCHVRAVERNAASRIAAERALKRALRDRAPGKTGGDLSADSRVLLLGEAWHAGPDNLSPITLQAYRSLVDQPDRDLHGDLGGRSRHPRLTAGGSARRATAGRDRLQRRHTARPTP
jgi:hypothetical protein